ncbi:alpha/beta hydrolase [soil metagenome]
MASWIEAVPEAALAEARAFNEKLEQILATIPSTHTLDPRLVRAARRQGKGIFPAPVFSPEAKDLEIETRAGTMKLRVVRPPGAARGVYLHIHGGGWTLGAHDMQDTQLIETAQATGLVVASVDYRLGPEHPFPAGIEDCDGAATWLVAEGAKALEAPARFEIGGESAGAHLAATTLRRLPRTTFYAANLVYGAYDMSQTPSQRNWGERNLVLSGPIIAFFGDCVLPHVAMEARRAPEISPLYADLTGMPPALFTVGTLDPLIDDTLFMEARWRAAGSATELRVWPEAVHGFNSFPIEIGKLANRAQYEFLASRLV